VSATKPKQADDWAKELDGLVLQVKQWFREASSRFAVPSDAGCYTVAFYIMAFRDHRLTRMTPDAPASPVRRGERRGHADDNAIDDQKKAIEHPDHKIPDHREKAIDYGGLFLTHIEPERRQLEQWIEKYSRTQAVPYWLEHDRDMLFRINEIRKHMKVVRRELSPELDGKPDPIRKLALLAQDAWAETNNGHAPSPKNADGPLCKFVQKALKAIGEHYTVGHICDVLRGYRRRGRGGRFA
jgi:hypothetical protein